MNNIEIQRIFDSPTVPESPQLVSWAQSVLNGRRDQADVVIRIVGRIESAELNQNYRKKQGATNVLSFGYGPIENLPSIHLGDLVVCAPVVETEAAQQHKTTRAHWAHMVIHGLLHLLGYDHVDDEQAKEMEELEVRLLLDLGFANPYEEILVL